MRRRDFLVSVSLTLVSLRVHAQQPEKMRRIGVLVSGAGPHQFIDYLRKGLASLGYREGKNIRLDVRYANGNLERAHKLAAELVGLKVDIIVAHFTPAAIAAKKATQTIPIVMAPAGAPLQTGLIASLARPGANITGLSGMAAELGGKRLQILRELIPNLSRVAVLASLPDPFSKPYLKDMQESAKEAGIQLQPVLVNGPDDFENAFASMAAAKAQAVLIQPLFDTHRAISVRLGTKYRLPIMSTDRETVLLGGLVSHWVDETELYERASLFVDRILKGANPANLPVEQPTRFFLMINLVAAKALGLTVPQSLIVRADEVIQ